ncbi:MAG: metallophosphoesterase [Planctomycetota bacterium]
MKLLYTSDLHGSEPHYARLIALAGRVKPDVVILGGDLLPDDLSTQPSKMGVGQPQWVRKEFRKSIVALRDASGAKHVLVIFGNHDWASSVTAMKELATEGLLTVLDLKSSIAVSGLNFLGYSCTPPTPFYVKDFERLDMPGDIPPLLGGARWDPRFSRPGTHGAAHIYSTYPSLADELASLKPPPAPWVFVAHAPPFDSGLDKMYSQQCAGSKAIRTAIETHQPMLSLHGHIHDSPKVTGQYQSKIGKTIAANPGQSGALLHHLIIDVDVSTGAVRGMEYGQQA